MSLVRHALTCILFCAGVSATAASNAISVDFTKYDVYYGDFDGDGYDNDIYIHGKDVFVLLHGEISVPLYVPGPEGELFVEQDYYSHRVGEPLRLSKAQLAGYTQAIPGADYILGDIGENGTQELVVRGRGKEHASLILSHDGTDITLLANIDNSGRTYSVESGLSEQSIFHKNFSDRAVQIAIVSGNLEVGDLTFQLAADGSFASVDPLAIDENIAAPTPAVMASPSATASQIQETDRVSTLGGAFRVSESGEVIPPKTEGAQK